MCQFSGTIGNSRVMCVLQLSAVVDGVYSEHSHTAGTFSVLSSSRVYMGGSQNTHALPGSRINNNFVGCLRKVLPNIHSVTLLLSTLFTQSYVEPGLLNLTYFRTYNPILFAVCTSFVIRALCFKPEGRGFKTRWGEWVFFKIYLILPAALGPGFHSASNRSEYQKQKNNVSVE
jgi:hypothetical protein